MKPRAKAATRRRTPVQTRSRQIKATILEATHKVMRERGVRAITTNAIAEHADIRVASIYDYFSNKEEIVAELYRDKLAAFRHFLDAEALRIEARDWQRQVAAMIRTTWAYQLSIGFDRALVDAAYYFEDLFDIARAHAHLVASTYARLLQRLGSHRSEAELHDLGISLYTLINATWSYWRLTASERQIAIDRQIEMTIMLMTAALETPHAAKPRGETKTKS